MRVYKKSAKNSSRWNLEAFFSDGGVGVMSNGAVVCVSFHSIGKTTEKCYFHKCDGILFSHETRWFQVTPYWGLDLGHS